METYMALFKLVREGFIEECDLKIKDRVAFLSLAY